MKLVFLGPPGAGKGTYAKVLSARENLPHISTGDILRAEMKADSDLGKEAKDFIESGKLVPDDLIIKMVRERLSQSDCANGFILDGFPRTVAQAEGLAPMSKEINRELDAVIYFKTSEEVVLFRLGGRRVCGSCGAIYHAVNRPPKKEGVCDDCGSDQVIIRKDDQPDTIKNRLKVYEAETAPLISFYESTGLLKEVDGNLEVEALDGQVKELLAASSK
jgi:adenylate kinase